MITKQPSNTTADLVSNDPDIPVYGGYKEFNELKSELKGTSESLIFGDLIYKRAKEENRKHNQKSARALIEIGDAHYEKGSFTRAASAYINALKIDEDNIPTFQKLIQSLVVSNQLDTAENFYVSFLQKVNYHPRYLNDYLAYRIMISTSSEEIANQSTEIFNKYRNSKDDAILNSLGLFFAVIKQDVKTAEEYFRKSLVKNPDNIHANNNLGALLRNQQNFVDAEKLLQKAHYLDLSYLSAYENLAGLYYMQKNLPKAINILENAGENNIELSNLWKHNLAMFYFQNSDFETSIKSYASLFETEPDNGLILNNIGAIYEKIDKSDIAITYFNDAIRLLKLNAKSKHLIDRRAVMAFINKSRILFKSGKPDDALKILKDAQRYFPNEIAIYHFESVIYVSKNEINLAKERLRLALQVNPNYLDALADLSYLLADRDFDFPGVIKLLENINFDTEYPIIDVLANNLAYAYIKSDQLDKALPLLRDHDKSYASLATKGFYQIKIGNLSKAKKYYDQAIESASSNVKDKVHQFYYFELMEYWRSENNLSNALFNARKSAKFNENSVVYDLVQDFIHSFDKVSKN